jgi:hypothetical protein
LDPEIKQDFRTPKELEDSEIARLPTTLFKIAPIRISRESIATHLSLSRVQSQSVSLNIMIFYREEEAELDGRSG